MDNNTEIKLLDSGSQFLIKKIFINTGAVDNLTHYFIYARKFNADYRIKYIDKPVDSPVGTLTFSEKIMPSDVLDDIILSIIKRHYPDASFGNEQVICDVEKDRAHTKYREENLKPFSIVFYPDCNSLDDIESMVGSKFKVYGLHLEFYNIQPSHNNLLPEDNFYENYDIKICEQMEVLMGCMKENILKLSDIL